MVSPFSAEQHPLYPNQSSGFTIFSDTKSMPLVQNTLLISRIKHQMPSCISSNLSLHSFNSIFLYWRSSYPPLRQLTVNITNIQINLTQNFKVAFILASP